MPTRALLLLPLLAALVLPAAEEADQQPLPTAAEAVLEKQARAEEKLIASHRQELIAERLKAIDALGRILKDTTKSGDLDAANAVKARIDALRARNAEDMPGDLLGEGAAAAKSGAPDLAKLIVGEWNFTKATGLGGIVSVAADGALTANLGPISVSGRWEVVKEPTTKAKRIRFVWLGDQSRWEEIASIDGDRAEGDSSDGGKGGITLMRRGAAARPSADAAAPSGPGKRR